jgi:hypothetical protein
MGIYGQGIDEPKDEDGTRRKDPVPHNHARGEALSAAVASARSRLQALLRRPDLLTFAQKQELHDLVDLRLSELGTDIDRFRDWSQRAHALVQAIDHTPRGALSDSEWTALLHEARKAVEEAHATIGRIGFRPRVEMVIKSTDDRVVEATRKIVEGPVVEATRKIVEGPVVEATKKIVEDPEVRATRKIVEPRDWGRSTRDCF